MRQPGEKKYSSDPVAWKAYCVEYWIKELQEDMDMCTGCCEKLTVENDVKHHKINHTAN